MLASWLSEEMRDVEVPCPECGFRIEAQRSWSTRSIGRRARTATATAGTLAVC